MFGAAYTLCFGESTACVAVAVRKPADGIGLVLLIDRRTLCESLFIRATAPLWRFVVRLSGELYMSIKNSVARPRKTPFSARLFAFLLSAFFVASVFPFSVIASVTVDDGTTSDTITGNFSTSDDADSTYVSATNTFSDGSPVYYLVTQDATKSSLTSVAYQGVTYPLAGVVVGSDINAMKVTNAAGQSVSIFAANTTIFFDSGVYNDSDSTAYTRFSQTNLSLVGLYENASGDPTASLTKSARSDGAIERNIIMNQNVYYENLIFDGLSRNMTTIKNRGEYFFFISGVASPWDGTVGLVMKNCVIQNVGASNTAYSSKNVAINIYSSSGQHNFDGLIIRSVKTCPGYGIVSMNRSTNNYYYDLTIDGSSANTSANSIKIEDTDSGSDVPFSTYRNVFAGTLSLTQTGNRGYVYVQRYQYAGTYVPSEYRYARYSTSNGSTYSSAINIYSALPAASTSSAILDLTDNYWVVRTDVSTSVESQIAAIKTVLSRVASSGVPNSVPSYNIKLVTGTGTIGTFSVPDLGSSAVNLVAVNLLASGNPDAYNSTSLIPFSASGSITLKSTDKSGIKIYNVDFDSLAGYTMRETISGVSLLTPSDPNEVAPPSGYPVYSGYAMISSAKVSGSSSDTFANCVFSVLAEDITVNNSITELGLTQSITFDADISQGYTEAGVLCSSSTVSDTGIVWYSSDPSILSIDHDTGLATALSLGTVTITAKSVDTNNAGEIEKPYAIFTVNVVNLYQVDYDGNHNDSGTVPSSVKVLSGKTTIVLSGTDLVRDGYSFDGWNTEADGSGKLYKAGDSLTVDSTIVLYAHWVKNPDPTPTATPTATATPTPTAVPTTAPTATPASGALGVSRDPTTTPTASPTATPAADVLGVTKTGEQTNLLLPAIAISLVVISASCFVFLIIRRRNTKD